jgi:uncharacterized protein YjbI with pentapeptide repeats
LHNANLKGAQMQGAEFLDAQLIGADMFGVELQGAILYETNLQGADLQGVNMQGANLENANLQGVNLLYAELQGANLSKAKLQGANLQGAQLQGVILTGAELQGITWESANLDEVFISEISKISWSKSQQRKLESTLKNLLDTDRFIELQSNLKHIRQQSSPGLPESQLGCYSDDPKLLDCKKQDIEEYRANLHAYLVSLACLDAVIAESIANRGSMGNASDFGLAAVLLKEFDKPELCTGLAALSQEIRQELQEAATRQHDEMLSAQ